MEYNEAKKELISYQFYEIRSKAQIEEVVKLDAQSQKVNRIMTGMPSTYDPHALEEVWARYIDEVKKLIELLKKDIEAKKTIRTKLELLKTIDQEAETILEERYVRGKKLNEVADELYYSLPTIKRKVKSAIVKYANVII